MGAVPLCFLGFGGVGANVSKRSNRHHLRRFGAVGVGTGSGHGKESFWMKCKDLERCKFLSKGLIYCLHISMLAGMQNARII